jgi:hypothetical protein
LQKVEKRSHDRKKVVDSGVSVCRGRGFGRLASVGLWCARRADLFGVISMCYGRGQRPRVHFALKSAL